MTAIDILAAAPTPILAVVLIALYKIDRRLLRVEVELKAHRETEETHESD